MATFAEIFNRAQDGTIRSQIAVAITKDAKYAVGTSTDPDILNWANYVLPRAWSEAQRWQLAICIDPAIADAESVRDEDVAAACTALVPTMVASYKAAGVGG